MSIRLQYNQWAATYDAVENKTRDPEKVAAQTILSPLAITTVLELGCGTGKNTAWLSQKASKILAVDFSEEMLKVARAKINNAAVEFKWADITKPWHFVQTQPDLITCSLVLEHVENLPFIFKQASTVLQHGGYFFICELHPFKQYAGSKARFESSEGLQTLTCFTHHVSDYMQAAKQAGFTCKELNEWFDKEGKAGELPRLISFLFQLS